jgi:ethanolamine utilization cobalamin adenosyltransferase
MGGELIELEKNAGYQVVLAHLKDYTQKVKDIQEKYAFSNKDIMSPRLIVNSQLTSEEMATLVELKLKLDSIINEVAERVEKHRVVSYDDFTQRYELNAYDKLRVNTLVSSVRNINISIQKIKFTVETFSRCNKYIINELNECAEKGEVAQSKTLVLGNTLLIYELANYLISFLENFKLEGVDSILELSQTELKKIGDTQETLQNLRNNAVSPEIDDKVKDQVVANLDNREESLHRFKDEWDKYIDSINNLQYNVGSLKEKIPTLALIRDNAQNQLDFFEIMKIFGIIMVAEAVQKNLNTLEIVTLPLDELELISLPPSKVYALIGLSRESGNSQTG